MATRVGDSILIQVFQAHDPQALATVSYDGQTLTLDPAPWRTLFKKYTGWEIPAEVQDAKNYFMDRVILSPKEMFGKFQVFAAQHFTDQAKKISVGHLQPWRVRWDCNFPFNTGAHLTFIAQNVAETGSAEVHPMDTGIYLLKDPGTGLKSSHSVVTSQFYIKTVQLRLHLPTDFAGLQSSEIKEKMMDVFKVETRQFQNELQGGGTMVQISAGVKPIEEI